MLATDARILVRSAVATAIAGVILVVVGASTDGGKGALGAACAVLLVTVFFTLGVVAVSAAGRWGPAAMTGTALGSYVVKILGVMVFVALLRNTTLFNTTWFGATAIICILVWSAGQVATLLRRKVPYVVPEQAAARPAHDTREAGTAPLTRGADRAPGAHQPGSVPEARHGGGEP